MAGRITPYLVGTTCEVRIGDVVVMFGQNITVQDSWSTQQPYGLGDFSAKHNEPVLYNGGVVSFSVLRYTDAILGLDGKTLSGRTIQASVAQGTNRVVRATKKKSTDGNSLLFVESVSPALLIAEATVDIIIYAKHTNESAVTAGTPVFKAIDCLLQSMSTGHNVGALGQEQYSFACRILQDVSEEPDKQQNNA